MAQSHTIAPFPGWSLVKLSLAVGQALHWISSLTRSHCEGTLRIKSHTVFVVVCFLVYSCCGLFLGLVLLSLLLFIPEAAGYSFLQGVGLTLGQGGW